MPLLQPGQAAPWFAAPTHGNARFNFSSVAGRYVLLAVTSRDEAQARTMADQLQSLLPLLRLDQTMAFGILRSRALHDARTEHDPLRWFIDEDGEVSRALGGEDAEGAQKPHWIILDPTLRVLAIGMPHEAERILNIVRGLPSPDDHAGTPTHAPVLIVPRIFEPQICRQLIDVYEQNGGAPSGVMRQVGDRTVPILDNFKKRRDADVTDEALRTALRQRIMLRLIPEIAKAFQFQATRMERYIVAAYDAEDGGYFRPHRDNTTTGTAHRQFACSINLNAEGFEGGDLRFPEFGSRTYRPPTGGAVVFSCSLLHEATSVTAGRRYAFLPFFYDEKAAIIRQANASSLMPSPEPAAP